jgi:SAM-dependent methyltransferase
MAPEEDRSKRRARVRIVLFVALAFLTASLLGAVYQGLDALRRLEVVEAERDRWQDPSRVIEALDLREGKVVVDLGSGVGYFALKLSPLVGRNGTVLAVDLRRQALLFLRLRAFLGGHRNVVTVEARADDARVPVASADAVLIANTYHELADPAAILEQLSRALRPGGRLVIVDPVPGSDEAGLVEAHHHESADSADRQLRRAGFEILSRQDRFIEPAGGAAWWLIVARKR